MKFFTIITLVLCFAVCVGAQWQKVEVQTDASFRGLDVVSEKVIWASGTGGTIIRTIDGGTNWDVIKVKGAEKLDFRDIEAFDSRTAYILSIGNGDSSRIYKTTDGGNNWKLQFTNPHEKGFFDSIAFWDKDHGIAQSDPIDGKYVLFATNDGATWTQLPTNEMPSAKEGEAAFAASGTCIVTHGKKRIWLITGGMDARVFFSKNRGRSWKAYDTPIVNGTAGSGIFSIAMRDRKRGVIVGGNYEKPEETKGNLAITSDGGMTWSPIKGLAGYRSGVSYIDKNNIIAVGSGGSDLSRDGGTTWINLDKENYNAVQSLGDNSTWAVGPKGMVARLLKFKN
jgi:photosystem II stability/assembly factor-like uncharacterized protein